MAKQTLDDLLSKARDKLHDENIVTLLGEPDAGKTVASALLKHALFNKFIPLHGRRFEAIAVKGGEATDDVLRTMKSKGAFPPATLRANAPRLELEIYKMYGEGNKSTLVLQDSSGENHMSMLRDEFDDPKERLEKILAYNNQNGGVGPLAPYVFSKVYLLTIECPEDSSSWDTLSPSSTIHALRQLHRAAKLTHNDKVTSHIAILFTKSDVLPDNDRHAPASQLLERVQELKSALKIVHGGKLECFKLSIDVEPESTQERDQRVGRSLQRAKDDLKREEDDYNQKLTASINEIAARAQKDKESEYDGEELEQYVKEAKSKADQRFRSSHPAPRLQFDESKEREIKNRVKKEFNYSQDEYVRLINWIIDRLYD